MIEKAIVERKSVCNFESNNSVPNDGKRYVENVKDRFFRYVLESKKSDI